MMPSHGAVRGVPSRKGRRQSEDVASDAGNRAIESEITEALQDPDARIGHHKSWRSLVQVEVIFKDSRSELLLQVADIVAYILQKHCRGGSLFVRWFDALGPSM